MIADYDGDISRLFDDGIDGDLPILVTRNLVLFPGVVTPILIGRTASVNLVKRLQEQQDAIFAVFSQNWGNAIGFIELLAPEEGDDKDGDAS